MQPSHFQGNRRLVFLIYKELTMKIIFNKLKLERYNRLPNCANDFEIFLHRNSLEKFKQRDFCIFKPILIQYKFNMLLH